MEEHPEYHFSKTLSGAIYPTGYVTAIIDNLGEAEKAIIDLRKGGFDIKDIVLVTNDQAARIVNEYDQKHNLLIDLWKNHKRKIRMLNLPPLACKYARK